jgi:hypothetical protein
MAAQVFRVLCFASADVLGNLERRSNRDPGVGAVAV